MIDFYPKSVIFAVASCAQYAHGRIKAFYKQLIINYLTSDCIAKQIPQYGGN